MSQKSSVPQAVSFVSQVLKRDKLYLLYLFNPVQKSSLKIRTSKKFRYLQIAPPRTTSFASWNVRFMGYLLNLQRSRS